MKVIDEDHNVQYKEAREGINVGFNQKIGEKRTSRYDMPTRD